MVVDKLAPTINKAVRVYAPNVKSDIVNQRARILAAEAVKSYNPKMGANLQTHVIRQLQRLQQLAPKIVDPLPMPERFRREQMLVYQHSKDLEDILGREPTKEELMHAVKLPKARLNKILRLAHARIASSVYEDAQDDDDEGKDLLSADDPEKVWREAVYHGLGDVDKYIFEHKLGYDGAKILDTNHMAMKLRMSPSAISQRASRIQQQLDQAHVGY